jgi:hypothetical protein
MIFILFSILPVEQGTAYGTQTGRFFVLFEDTGV